MRREAQSRPVQISYEIRTPARVLASRDATRQWSSASTVKWPLLLCVLRSHPSADLDGYQTSLVERMIRYSDNDATSALMARYGPTCTTRAARATHAPTFEAHAGSWGSSRISARDGARIAIGWPSAIPARHRPLARRLLSSVTPSQVWGKSALPAGWKWQSKGGWLPTGYLGRSVSLHHQIVRLQSPTGCIYAIAIMSDGSGSFSSSSYLIDSLTQRAVRVAVAAETARTTLDLMTRTCP
jgi:hypothetical protein